MNTAVRLTGSLNPHLFLQRSLYKVDVVQSLKNFNTTISNDQTNFEFHNEMARIFSTMNDFHTVYERPPPLRDTIAILLIVIQRIFERGEWRYIVSNILGNANDVSPLQVGSEIVSYDGIPIEKAVQRMGAQGFGSNRAAQIANGVLSLFVRALAAEVVPLKEEVSIKFLTQLGSEKEISLKWFFLDDAALQVLSRFRDQKPTSKGKKWWNKLSGARRFVRRNGQMHSRPQGRKWEATNAIQNLSPKRFLGHSDLWHISEETAQKGGLYDWADIGPKNVQKLFFGDESQKAQALEKWGKTVRINEQNRTVIPVSLVVEDFISAELVNTTHGEIGILRLLSFSEPGIDEIADEVERLLGLMPADGVVIDIRGNPGGDADTVKATFELLSGKEAPLLPTSLRATKLMSNFLSTANARFGADEDTFLSAGMEAVQSALRVDERFSGPTTSLFTPQTRRPQAYKGPVVTLVDGLTYSGGDVFTALQIDQNASRVVGVDANVGAGGATVVDYSLLVSTAPTVFKPLPGNVSMSTSFRRYYRTGPNAGAIIESFGVKPDDVYNRTRKDVLGNDCDLYEFLGGVLRAELNKRIIGALTST